MLRSGRVGAAALAIGVLLCGPSGARAQSVPYSPAPQASLGAAANPYMNPYLNPYLNPVAAQLNPYGTQAGQPRLTPATAGLFLYQANIANGGIGAGRISGTKPMAGARQKVAVIPDSSSVPGGGAAKYFNPGPVNVNGAGRYFNRSGSRFMNNHR